MALQTLTSSSFDDFLNMDLLDQTTLNSTNNLSFSSPVNYSNQLPVQIQGNGIEIDNNNNGMSFSELFR